MTYLIKHIEEDFIVEEVPNIQVNDGSYTYLEIKKKDFTTFEAVRRLAQELRIPEKSIGIAGNKDRKAVTTQVVSVKKISDDRINNLNLENIDVKIVGKGNEPVKLGMLRGNNFKIIVRNLDHLPEIKSKFINFYGEQRFSEKNVAIGKLIVHGKLEEAAKLLSMSRNELIALPKRLLSLYVHSYQSFLWNKVALLKEGEPQQEVPIVGFGTEDVDDKTQKVLDEENLSPRDFIIRQIPNLSAEGSSRSLYAEAENLEVGNLEEDEFHQGKKKIRLSFFLQKGSYATEFIQQNFAL